MAPGGNVPDLPNGGLVVLLEGAVAQIVPLGPGVIRLGRLPENTVVLSDASVSRYHAEVRVEGRDPQATLTDVGSAGGTFVGDERLRPNQPFLLYDGTAFRIGPFEIQFVAPRAQAPVPDVPRPEREKAPRGSRRAPEPAPSFEELTIVDYPTRTLHEAPPPPRWVTPRFLVTTNGQVTGDRALPHRQETSRNIKLSVDAPSLELIPGKSTTLRATVVNASKSADSFGLSVEGVPKQWVKLPTGTVRLEAGGKAVVAIVITAPDGSYSVAGAHFVNVSVRAEQDGEFASVPCTWIVMQNNLSRYLRHLPGIYHDADFLGRLLLICEAIWEPLEWRQNHIEMYFDPKTAPAPFLPWLASWLGIDLDRHWPEERRRLLLARAMDLYRSRGTYDGLKQMIEVCTGLKPTLTEDPRRPFVVRIQVRIPADSLVRAEMIERLIQIHKPAHVGYVLEATS